MYAAFEKRFDTTALYHLPTVMFTGAAKLQALMLNCYQYNLPWYFVEFNQRFNFNMTALFQACVACLACSDPADDTHLDEKLALLSTSDPHTASQVADQVVDAILSADKFGPILQAKLDSIVGCYGWTQKVAEWILYKLSIALKAAHDNLGSVVRDAYHRSWDVAVSIEGFVTEHPVFCTVIALGVLVIIAPWVIEALGFAAEGPLEGMCIESKRFTGTDRPTQAHLLQVGRACTVAWCPRGHCSLTSSDWA